MAEFFRAAAKCDRTTAAKAPVPIYDIDIEVDIEEEKLDEEPTVQDRFARLTGLDRVRAQQHDGSMRSLRQQKKREASVLYTESVRAAKEAERMKEIDERNALLLEELKQRKANGGATMGRNNGEKTTKVTSEEEEEGLEGEDEDEDFLVEAIGPRKQNEPKIDIFDRIRLEERRLLQQHNKKLGIIGMYNEWTLNTAQASLALAGNEDDEKKKSNLLFPSQIQSLQNVDGGKKSSSLEADAAGAKYIIPDDVKELLKQGKGKAKNVEVQIKLQQEREKLKLSLVDLSKQEKAEVENTKSYLASKDLERTKMLMELVAQDNERRKAMPSTSSSSSSVSALIDPSESILRLGKNKKKHPIDIYQEKVREEMLQEVNEQHEQSFQKAYEKLH